MNLQTWLNKIHWWLAIFPASVRITNKNSHFELNKLAENLFIPVFNILFDTEFTNVNISESANFPAIDLSSKTKRISIQITSEKDIEKVKYTLEKFISNRLFNDYDKLFHFIITEKQDSYSQTSIDTKISEECQKLTPPVNDFTFDVKKHIIDQSDLFGLIENAGIDKIEKVHNYMEKAFGNPIFLFGKVTVLLPYREFFSKQLDPTTTDLQYQLHNPFFGREVFLESLKQFIDDEKRNIIAVIADGGFGKTRLCIEFFKKEIEPREKCSAYVLNPINFQCIELSEQLKDDELSVILFDDAHKHPQVLVDVKRLIEKKLRAKLILTVRESVYDDMIRQLSTNERNLEELKLDKLGYEETQSLFRSQLPGLKTEGIKSLSEQSKGIPLVILGICQVLREGKTNDELSEEDFFKRFVREHFKQIIDEINQRTGLPTESISRVIQMISLISPIVYNDSEMKLLSDLSGTLASDTYLIVDHLGKAKVIEKGPTFSIKPDPYSDVILLDNISRLKPILSSEKSLEVIDRVIKNLSSVEHSARLDINLDNLLYDFISDIKKPEITKSKLSNILDTVLQLAYKKPKICIQAVKNYLDILENPEHKLNKETTFFQRSNISVLEDFFGKIDDILSVIFLNIHGEIDLMESYITLLRYATHRSSTRPFNSCFRYREYDFYDYGYNPVEVCERQRFILEKLEAIDLKTSDEFKRTLIRDVCVTLLSTEIQIQTYFDKYTHQFTYGHAPVPKNNITVEIRTRCLNLLSNLYDYERQRSIQ